MYTADNGGASSVRNWKNLELLIHTNCVHYSKQQPIDTEYCILDTETTGIVAGREKIIEIAALKVKNGKIINEFTYLVNPEKAMPESIIKITGITNEMVNNAETIDKIIPKLVNFIGDSVLVMHNAEFHINFLRCAFENNKYKLENTYVDMLELAKKIFPKFKRYQLKMLAENLNIKNSIDVLRDYAKTELDIFNIMVRKAKEKGANIIDDFDNLFETNSVFVERMEYITYEKLIDTFVTASPTIEVKALIINVGRLKVKNKVNESSQLLIPVVTDPKKANTALIWTVSEMTCRYNLFSDGNVRDIEEYNQLFEKEGKQEALHQIVIVIDDYSVFKKEKLWSNINETIQKLFKKGEKAGIYIIAGSKDDFKDTKIGNVSEYIKVISNRKFNSIINKS